MARSQAPILRQWTFLKMLSDSRVGVLHSRAIEELGVSRATFYRDLKALREAGLPIFDQETDEGTLYRFEGRTLPPLAPTILELSALFLGRQSLQMLEGTQLVEAYDRVLSQYRKRNAAASVPPQAKLIVPPQVEESHRKFLRQIESAIEHDYVLRCRYRSNSGEESERLLEPVRIHIDMKRADQVYFHAWDRAKEDFRTFKVRRVVALEKTDDEVLHPSFEEWDLVSEHAVSIWNEAPTDVVVLIRREVAHLLSEWPLVAEQEVIASDEHWVSVHARVSGIWETLRWVLRWGRQAHVLQPSELRTAVMRELQEAAALYSESAAT